MLFQILAVLVLSLSLVGCEANKEASAIATEPAVDTSQSTPVRSPANDVRTSKSEVREGALIRGETLTPRGKPREEAPEERPVPIGKRTISSLNDAEFDRVCADVSEARRALYADADTRNGVCLMILADGSGSCTGLERCMSGIEKVESQWSLCEIRQKSRASCHATVEEFRSCEQIYRDNVRAKSDETCAETESNAETMRRIITHADCNAYTRKC